MDMKLPSQNVRVFPFGNDRSQYDSYGRVLNEQNLSSMIRAITDNKSYVVSYDSENDKLVCVIYGYYFELILKDQDGEDITSNYTSDIYATISIVDAAYDYLNGNDTVEGKFSPLTLSETQSSDTNTISLHILTKNNSTWRVPNQSWKKFEEKSLSNNILLLNDVDRIYCGTSKDILN